MMRSVVALVATALVVTGCSGSDRTEGEPYQASIGSNERTGTNEALGMALVVDSEGNGRVVGTLANTTSRDQQLVSAEVSTERGPAVAAVLEAPIGLPPGESVQLAREPAVSVAAEDFPVGFFVELDLTIRGGAPMEVLVPVEAQQGPYAEIEVTEPPDDEVAP